MKIKINILHWFNGDQNRLNNVKLSWSYLNKFTDCAKENGLDISPFLFDFSEDNPLPGSIHIPYKKGEYKRSHKINNVIDYHSGEDYFLAILDADLIINPYNFERVIEFLKTMTHENYYVSRLYDINNVKGIDFNNLSVDFNRIEVTERPFEPDLGGIFFVYSSAIESIRFDESFIVWGGEDNITSYKLKDAGYKKVIIPTLPFHLPHVHEFQSEGFDITQYNQQASKVYNYNENKTI